MSTIKDGGPAFPTEDGFGWHVVDNGTPSEKRCESVAIHHPGMTLRDYLAASALQLFYWQRPDKVDDEQMQVAIARYAYSVADAMLAEREKGGGK